MRILKILLKISAFLALFFILMLGMFYIYLASAKGEPALEHKIFTRQTKRPLVMAHRGGLGLAPENTLEAFEKAFDLGVDVLELDVHVTKDGTLVVMHDKTVDRTTDGKGAIIDLNYSEIQKLDAGYRWTKDDGKTFPFRGKGIKIPTLREVFEKFPEIIINIEPKNDMPEPVKPLCDLIKEFDREDKVIVGSFHNEILEEFRQSCSGVATSASPSEASGFLARFQVGLEDNYKPEMQALQVPPSILGYGFVTKEYIEAAHSLNIQVHVWTINDGDEMKKLIRVGVDGIMTDYPDRLIGILEAKE